MYYINWGRLPSQPDSHLWELSLPEAASVAPIARTQSSAPKELPECQEQQSTAE